MVGPTPIELGPLFRSQLQLGLLLMLGQALPEAIASSARSSAGSFSRLARLLDGMPKSSHGRRGDTRERK
jgi:hypothetical protein